MIVFNQVNYRKIHDLSFQIERGEIVLFFNREKDCLRDLMGLLSGEVQPESGLIRLTYNPTAVQSDLGQVYRENILLADRTLAENLFFVMQIKGVKRPYREIRLNRVLQSLELETLQEYLPGGLSPFQLLKANIAQALVTYPSFLLLEEPVQGLDEVNSQALLHLLEALNRLSLTVMVLSGDPVFIRRSHQRIIRLERPGRADRKKGSYA